MGTRGSSWGRLNMDRVFFELAVQLTQGAAEHLLQDMPVFIDYESDRFADD